MPSIQKVGAGKVVLGFFSFTEITDPNEHHSYNEWHMLDHMPEQYPLKGIVYGQRWVSTPACRAARAVDGELLAPIHYVTLYLMADPIDETLAEFMALGRHLHEVNRFHEHRIARLSGPFEVTGMRAAPRVLVSAEAVPYRPNRGVYVVVEDEPDRTRPVDLDGLTARAGVAGAWSFSTSPRFAGGPWKTGDRRITVCWLDDDPLTVAAALVAPATPEPAGSVAFAGPFETVVPWQWDWFDAGP